MILIKESLHSDGYVIQEEGMLLDRMGNTNFFKDDPYDPWSYSSLRDSLVELDPNDIEYTETPSDTKLLKMGEYKDPVYNEYSTDFPVAIQYKGKIFLLNGHHRVELAKRASQKLLVGVKNVDNKYLNDKIIKESLNEIKKNIEGSGLGAIGIGKVKVFPAYQKTKDRWPTVFKTFEDLSSIAAAGSVRVNKITSLLSKINKKPTDALWVREDWLLHYMEDNLQELSEFKEMWSTSPDCSKISDDNNYEVMFYDKEIKMGMYLEDEEYSEDKFYFLMCR